MTISIIGSGNLAWHLIQVFEEHSIRVAELYARNKKNAEGLTGYAYDVKIQHHPDFRSSASSVFFLAVSDDAIYPVASELLLPPGSILVHTSGAKSLEVLEVTRNKNPDIKLGVFYPLMTFTKGIRVDFFRVPLCIEGEDETTEYVLLKLAGRLSREVQAVSSYSRSMLHVAAVFGCNFVNHLLALSKEIVEEENLSFDMLKPLMKETFRKAMASEHPADVQTGPAVRDDSSTIALHQNLIKDDSDLLTVYKTLTQSIQDWHQD
jgi:predicted short-subunit dehydrogenase-like oxidoreductase (DUF2520 family)